VTHPRFNGVELTPETIALTRQHFADIHRACIREAEAGEVRVNDLASYVQWQEACIRSALDETSRLSVTFLQRAYWLQTGDCPALLP
jgi:hypothetical protein